MTAVAGASPAVFHITHWKAGSQWVRAVLHAAAPDRIVPLGENASGLSGAKRVAGGIYTPLYLRADQFRAAVPADFPQRSFVVVRDPRDTLVSWYFSLKYSHPEEFAGISTSRAMLRESNIVEGMAILLREHLYDSVAIQASWADAGAKIFRYEDLAADQHAAFARILKFCEIELPADRLSAIIDANDFEKTSGRKPGQEDVHAHLRKGTPGDWRNHFCRRLKTLFKSNYGETLIRMGYESNWDW